MQLSDKQQRILAGEICPYCGGETEKVDAGKLYGDPALGEVAMCKPCNAFVGTYESGPNKGKAKGRLANPKLRSIKARVGSELDRLWKTPEEKERMETDLAEFLSIPKEYANLDMLGEKTMGKVLQFCFMNKDRSGSNIGWYRPGYKCPNGLGQIIAGSSACRGCPEYLLDGNHDCVWCDPDMSYGKLKNGSV